MWTSSDFLTEGGKSQGKSMLNSYILPNSRFIKRSWLRQTIPRSREGRSNRQVPKIDNWTGSSLSSKMLACSVEGYRCNFERKTLPDTASPALQTFRSNKNTTPDWGFARLCKECHLSSCSIVVSMSSHNPPPPAPVAVETTTPNAPCPPPLSSSLLLLILLVADIIALALSLSLASISLIVII